MANQKQPRASKLERTAYHEAGHVVAMVRLRKPLRYVTIVPTATSHGHVMQPRPPSQLIERIEWGGSSAEKHLQRYIMIDMAGNAAEANLTGRNNWVGARQDFESATDHALRIGGNGEGTSKYLAWMWFKTRAFIAAPAQWPAVEALAAALIDKRRIGAANARRIVREAMAPAPLSAHLMESLAAITKKRSK